MHEEVLADKESLQAEQLIVARWELVCTLWSIGCQSSFQSHQNEQLRIPKKEREKILTAHSILDLGLRQQTWSIRQLHGLRTMPSRKA